ncbi:T9SS type A sorting domain-containing protein [Kordia jejudonensis]|uniref:T9SS type A sorting domain-containing protein n=1 Tax=Kordia jejudonensis TaxID=1348245 RepID=UPI000629069F|nr:T9SS type A sorting domain-containing protein [Kordia jejudonensis]
MKIYTKHICALLFLIAQISWSQNNAPATHDELNQRVFGNIIPHCDTNFLLNLSNAQSSIFQLGGQTSGQQQNRTASDWILAYNDLYLSNLSQQNPYEPLANYYTEMAKNRHQEDGDIIKIPIGVLFTTYNFVDVETALAQQKLTVASDGYKLKLNANPQQVIQKETVFAANILADELSVYETVRVSLENQYNISQEQIQSIEIIQNGVSLGILGNGSYVDIQLNVGVNNFTVKYTSQLGNLFTDNFTLIGKGLPSLTSSSAFSISNILSTGAETFTNSNMYGQSQKAEIKVFYGCNNKQRVLTKPAIMVMGYNPLNIENFITLVTKYNTNGYLDELHQRNFDVIVIRFGYGADRIENQALLVKDIVKTINQRKFNNGSYIENHITGYSSGALVARMALKMMETDYSATPIVDNLHHSRLLISYDGEHKGANIPLAAQHSLVSILENPQWYLPATDVLGLLEQYFFISSPLAKDFLIYHYTQTGDAGSPTQAPHPFFVDSRHKLSSDYYYQPAPYDKPGSYPILRNIGVSDGADRPEDSNHVIGTLPDNATMLEIDKHVGFWGWDRHNFMEWRPVDGAGHMVFRRFFRKKPIFSGDWAYNVLLDEEKHVNATSWNTDGVQGSHVGIYNILRNFTKATFLQFSPAVDIESTDCFLPTSSALDINVVSQFEYDLRANNLLPETASSQTTQFGYPSISHGSGQYAITPFDAVYAAEIDVKHGAGSEDDPETPLLTEFMLDETHYDDIWLQFLRVGHFAGGSYNFYPVKYEAVTSIATGENVTIKTQKKPFIVLPEADVEMKAGETITFEPGTEIQFGAELIAYIAPVDECGEGKMMQSGGDRGNSNQNYDEIIKKEETLAVTDEQALTLYPNPSNNETTIYIKDFDAKTSYQIELYNIQGIPQLQLKTTTQKTMVNLQQLAIGIYVVKVSNGNNSYTTKLVKQ